MKDISFNFHKVNLWISLFNHYSTYLFYLKFHLLAGDKGISLLFFDHYLNEASFGHKKRVTYYACFSF